MCENVRGDLEALSFAMDEVRLFLDTHPTNTCALKAYRELRVQRDAAVKAYEAESRESDYRNEQDSHRIPFSRHHPAQRRRSRGEQRRVSRHGAVGYSLVFHNP